jgi:hypothetical protein
MKIDVFKKLIKESVREVLREELSSLNLQQPIQENKTISFNSQDVDTFAYRKNLANMMGLEIPESQQTKSTGNPYLDVIAQTAATMTPQEKAQMRQNMYD